ncbi:hypothetical protein U9M48_015387 [Paspalum notatum var. saurae]|uniref:Uncharacterized protein n=1 Tax=Paspalum notatum var. saurae TaxID=547442 RepID=A0AAQ3T6F5_PASNO
MGGEDRRLARAYLSFPISAILVSGC